MKVMITEKGVTEKEERIEVGSVINVKGETIPGYLVNKCRIVDEAKRGKAAKGKSAESGVVAKHKAGGKYAIYEDGEIIVDDVSKEDAEAFNSMSVEYKTAYLESLDDES